MSLLFYMLSRFVIAFLPRSKYLLILWLQSPPVVILSVMLRKSKSCPQSHLFLVVWPFSLALFSPFSHTHTHTHTHSSLYSTLSLPLSLPLLTFRNSEQYMSHYNKTGSIFRLCWVLCFGRIISPIPQIILWVRKHAMLIWGFLPLQVQERIRWTFLQSWGWDAQAYILAQVFSIWETFRIPRYRGTRP